MSYCVNVLRPILAKLQVIPYYQVIRQCYSWFSRRSDITNQTMTILAYYNNRSTYFGCMGVPNHTGVTQIRWYLASTPFPPWAHLGQHPHLVNLWTPTKLTWQSMGRKEAATKLKNNGSNELSDDYDPLYRTVGQNVSRSCQHPVNPW